MSGPQTGDSDISERVVRGFDAMVESEQATAGLARPPDGGTRSGAAPIDSGGGGGGGETARLADLEQRVRQTMEALSELVQAEIPEAVDSLRDELASVRIDVQSSLDQAMGDFAQERQELRAQIAKTVGAANKWFVKARDQLLERLDEVKAVASEAGAKAGGAGMATPVVELGKAPKKPVAGDFDWDVEGGEGPKKGPEAPARVEFAIESLELDTLMEPVRGDIRDLQSEIAAMGQALAELRAEVVALGKRVPAKPRPVRLDGRDIDLIIEAVMIAMEPPPPPKKAAAKRTVR